MRGTSVSLVTYRNSLAHLIVLIVLIGLLSSLAFAAPSGAATVIVQPADLGDLWIVDNFDTDGTGVGDDPMGSITAPNVALPGYGSNAFKMEPGAGYTPAAGGCDRLGGKVFLGTDALEGLKLSELTHLEFSMLVESAPYDPYDDGTYYGLAPYINIFVDTNGDEVFGAGDSILIMEPIYTTMDNSWALLDTWYTFNAVGTGATGRWHTAATPLAGVGQGAPNTVDLWSELIAQPFGGGTVGDLEIVNPIAGCGAGTGNEGTGSGIVIALGQKNGDAFREMVAYVDAVGLRTAGSEPISNGANPVFFDLDLTGPVVNSNTGDVFPSIQAAHDDIDTLDGHTLTVAAGTYAEQLILTKSLTINGADEATTIVTLPVSPVGQTVSGLNEIRLVTIGGGSTVTLNNLSLIGKDGGAAPCGSNPIGLYVFDGSTVNATSVTVSDFLLSPNGTGCQAGLAVYIGERGGGTTTGTAVFDDVEVFNFNKNGITANGAGSSVTVTNSYIYEGPADMSMKIAQNGIQIGRGATGSITNTTVSDLQCDLVPQCGINGASSSGILLFEHGAGVLIDNNTLTNNDASLLIASGSSSATISNNTVTARYFGVYGYDSILTFTDNSFRNAAYGMLLASWSGTLPTTVVGTGNRVTFNDTGVYVFDGYPADAIVPTASITDGRISSNAEGMVVEDVTGVIATCNYWGDPAGPGGVGTGTGDSVSTGATFAPWRIAPNGACIGTPQVAPVAVDDEVTVPYETATAFNVLANDTDANVGDVLSATALTQPTSGTLADLGGGAFLYTPNQNFTGEDSFTYTVSDGKGGSDVGLVTLTVVPLEDLLEGRGSFEVADALDPNQPDGWIIKRVGKSERVCDPLLVAEGNCALMLRSKLSQSANYQATIDPVRVDSIEVGDLLVLRAWFEGSNAKKGKVVVQIKAVDDTVFKMKLKSDAGTFDYPASAQFVSAILAKEPVSIKVVVGYPAQNGKLYVDGVVLQYLASPARPVEVGDVRGAPTNALPLPSVIDGFRGGN